MISFFISLFRLFKFVLKGILNDSEFRYILFFVILLLTASTIFYSQYENWSIIDSLYFSVMTMSTIGYGDFVPTTTISKVFTIIYTFLSIGSFVMLTAKIVGISLKDMKDKKEKIKKKSKELQKITKR